MKKKWDEKKFEENGNDRAIDSIDANPIQKKKTITNARVTLIQFKSK